MSSKSRSRSRSSSRSPKYSRRRRDESMSPIRTASGASLRTPKNYNSANRSYNYNNNYGYRNYGYNNRGYHNQRGYYNRWNRGRGNWRGQYNYRNQWNDRRRYNSRSDRSRSKSRSRSYDSRDSRSRSSSYDRSRSRSRSRDNKRRRTRSRSDRKSRSHSPRPKSIDQSKSDKKSPAKQEEAKPAAITVPSTTELVAEPEANDEDTGNEVKEEENKGMHFAESSAFTRSRWETPDGSPGKKESADVDLSQDEIFDRWDDDKLREYLLKSKGQKMRKESRKSTDSVEQEKVSSKKKKKRAKRESTSREARRSSSHDASSDSSFSPIHKALDKSKVSDGQEKYLPPDYDDEDNQSVEMQENSPPHSNEPYYPQEDRKDEKNEAVQYPFAHIKSPVQPLTQPPPPKQPTPVPPPAPTLPSIGEMQVLGPDGKPMKLVPVSIPGPDGNMIQVMQLQPIAAPQATPEPPKPPPQPVEPPKPPPQPKPPLPTAYPSHHQYQRAMEPQKLSRTDQGKINEDNVFPFSTNEHTENLRKMEMSQKMTRKPEVTKTRFKPKPAGSWAMGLSKTEPQIPLPAEIPKTEAAAEKLSIERKGQSIPSLVDASGKAKSIGTGIFTEQKIETITTTQSVRKVLQPRRSDQIWDLGNEETEMAEIHKKPGPTDHEAAKNKSKIDKVEQPAVIEKNTPEQEMKRESISKSVSKERESLENESSAERKKDKNAGSDESGDEVVKRKKDKKKKKKNKKKQREDEGGEKKKKKKQKEKSVEKNVVISLEHETIKSKKDLKAFDELNKKADDDNLVRFVDENLPLSHVRSMVPRKDDAGARPIFQHLASDDLASSSSYEDRFVSLFGSGPAEPAPKKEERIDLKKKSVRKFKVNVEGARAVSHMTEITISERIMHYKEGTDVTTTEQSSQKVSLNISGISGKTKSSVSRSRSRSRSLSSSASSEPPKKVKKKRKKSRRSSSKSSSRSRSRSLPAAYGGDDEKSPGKRRRDDSEGDSRRRSRDRYSRSPSTSGDERDRGRRQMYYNRNNQGYYYNNRGRGYYQNRNRGWHNYNYNNRGGYRGRWNNWNQGWNRNQNWRNQRYRDRYSRERSRSRSRSDRSSTSPDDRRSRSPARDKSPPEKRRPENLTKDNDQNQKAEHEDIKGTNVTASQGYNISEDEKPPGVD